LVERQGFLGGMATAALVHSICGLYLLREEPGALLAHPGFPSRMSHLLIEAEASSGPIRMGRLDVLPISPPGMAFVCDSLVAKYPNLEVRFHSELVSAHAAENTLQEVRCVSRGIHQILNASSWIDASGDASLCAAAGAGFDQAPATKLQRPAFIFSMHSVAVEKLDSDGRVHLAHQIACAVSDGLLPKGCLGAQFRPTGKGAQVYVTLDLCGPEDFNPTEPAHLSALERAGRRLAHELFIFLRNKHPAFHASELGAFPSRVGLRESRRVQGLETVTGNAVLTGSACDQKVAIGTWPMEIREVSTGPRWRFPQGNRPTQIPVGALRANSISNLWVAGRCISCDHDAQAALRVMGTCMATGQAAGAGATLQASLKAPSAEAVCTLIETLWTMEKP
jgi:hypothetical protein